MTLHDHRNGEEGFRRAPRLGAVPPVRDPAAHPPNLDEFVNGPLFNAGGSTDNEDVEAARDPKRRRLIHQASIRVAGRDTADQELIVSLSNELDSTMQELQRSNIALDTCQSSRADIERMQAVSRAGRTAYIQRQNERIAEQDRALQEMTTGLEEREWMVNDLSELNEMNRLLITRYQEYEDREAEVDDGENSRSSREQRRYTDQIDRLEQQLEDRRLEYEGVSAELRRLRRDRDDYHEEVRAAKAGLQQRQDEVAQREGVIARLTDQVDKMRGDSVNQRIKLDELRGQRTALRKEVQELRDLRTVT
jgi:chromosome segregation ATPase